MDRIYTLLGIIVAFLTAIFALVNLAGEYLVVMQSVATILIGVGVMTGR